MQWQFDRTVLSNNVADSANLIHPYLVADSGELDSVTERRMQTT